MIPNCLLFIIIIIAELNMTKTVDHKVGTIFRVFVFFTQSTVHSTVSALPVPIIK